MQIALFNLMTLNTTQETAGTVLRGTADLVALAEDVGFDAAWFAEHHASSFGVCPSPLMMAAHCAGRTRRILLGPAVLVLPLYHPLRLIEEIGFVDQVSDGRLILGIGSGHQPQEFRAFDVPLGERQARMQEIWDLLEMGFADGTLEATGAHYRMPPTDLLVRTKRNRRPPLFVASGDPAVIARAARSGVVPFISQGHRDLAAALPMRDGVAAAFRAAGVVADPLPLAVQRYVFVTESRDEARVAAEGLLHVLRKILSLRDAHPARDGLHLRSVPFAGEPTVDWLLAHAPIGDPERCAELLAADAAALQPCHLSVFMGFSGLPQAALARSVELFGRDVIPHLRQQAAVPVPA